MSCHVTVCTFDQIKSHEGLRLGYTDLDRECVVRPPELGTSGERNQ